MRYPVSSTAGAIVLLGGLMWSGSNFTRPITAVNKSISTVASSTSKIKIEEPKETALLFGGDVMLSRGINNVMSKRDDFEYPFRLIQNITASSSLAVINLEGPISSRGKNVGSIYSFRADPKSVDALTFAGVGLVTLANNHSGDYGPDALLDTLDILQKAGIETVGAGTDMKSAQEARILTVNGLKIAFLGATPYSPSWLTRASSTPAVAPLNEQEIKESIASARQRGADVVVVLLHWGNEYETTHNQAQETLAHHLIDAGATMVIGHHPHVVQEVEEYNGGIIAYSLGNFVFDQNFSTDTQNGLLLKVILKGKSIAGVEKIPIRFSNSYQPYLLQAATTTKTN